MGIPLIPKNYSLQKHATVPIWKRDKNKPSLYHQYGVNFRLRIFHRPLPQMTDSRLLERTRNSPATFVSLFSGCGGFDMGFTAAGYRCIGAFDSDPSAIDVHHQNLKSPAVLYDLSKGLIGMPSSLRPTVLLSGSPCQGFSTAGKRNFHDPRNVLLLVSGHTALKLQPNIFIAENVMGVASGDHAIYWNMLADILRQGGYQTMDILLMANRLGLAQMRRRRLLIAWNTRACIKELPQNGSLITLRDVLIKLEGVANHVEESIESRSQHYLIAQRIGPGQKLCNVRASSSSVHTWEIPEVFGHIIPAEQELLMMLLKLRRRNRLRTNGDADPVTESALEHALGHPVKELLNSLIEKRYIKNVGQRFDLVHTFNGKYRRLRWDKPSFTVDTRFGSPRYFLHPEKNRGFTVREAARIQGFPDWFTFEGSLSTQYRHVGNAVPPPMAYQIANYIKDALLK